MADARYTAREFPNLQNLEGLSQGLIATHLKLYQGYVANTNKLIEQLAALRAQGKASPAEPAYAEMVRRLGFEYNGMILHEYYFDNMVSGGASLAAGSPLRKAIENSFGSYEKWETDFRATAALRGIGWAILYKDPGTKHLSNHWVTEHEDGHPAGYTPVLVLDVWEHAFLADYAPADRPKYIDAFLKLANWEVAERRFLG